jgi:hypothetical protein
MPGANGYLLRAGRTGGYFELPAEAALEPLAARSVADQGEFIFDVQGHFIDMPKGNPKRPDVFVKDVFLDSDTDMMVLSFVASRRDAEQAAHVMGKLFRYCGEDNVLWGTDSIGYGSPQDQIQAFRTFQISAELREKHGYPQITPALRAKVFGLNAARVYGVSAAVVKKLAARAKLAYQERPEPHFRTWGPKTRRKFLRFASTQG